MAAPDEALAFKVNPKVVATSDPPIPLAAAWASLYASSADEPIVNLAQGVPGAPPPDEFLQRLGDAASQPSSTTYGDLRGDEGLRKAFVADVNQVYGGDVGVDEVVLTAGCNLAFYSAMVSLASAGDEVILPAPWYFNAQMTLTQLGITPVPLSCLPPSFLPSIDTCRALITPKTRAIVLVTPNNPTGAIISPTLLAEFGALAVEMGVALVLDETYREFLDDRPHDLFTTGEPSWRKYLIHLFSFSKSYAIPGHRLGAIIAPLPFLLELHKTLDCLQICPARPAQVALEWGIEGIRPWREGVRAEIKERGRVFRELMEDVEGWDVETCGGYFAYVRHPYPEVGSELVAKRLASIVGVVVLPGSFFNPPFDDIKDDRYLRFSIANVQLDKLRLVPARLRKLDELWPSLS